MNTEKKLYITLPERNWNAHSADLREMLGLRRTDKLPPEGMPRREVQGITVWVEPAPLPRYEYKPGFYVARKVKSSRHRVRALCPACGLEVSAGRLHQHAKMHEAEAYDARLAQTETQKRANFGPGNI